MEGQFDRIMNYILEDPILVRQLEDYDQDTLTAIAQDNVNRNPEEVEEAEQADWKWIQTDTQVEIRGEHQRDQYYQDVRYIE